MVLVFLAADAVMLFVGWEIIGIASVLLVGYYSARSQASLSGLKAALYNRCGDFGLLLLLGVLLGCCGTAGWFGA